MSSLRDVTVVVANTETGDTYLARSYPHDDYDDNGRIELYRVPVHKVFIKGTDASNKEQTKTWRAVRFFPYWNDPKKPDPHYRTKGWVNAGLHALTKRAVPRYKPDYGVQNCHSPFAGAIVMRDSFYIHAGPQSLSEQGWGSAGCVEIVGNFDTFKNDIRLLSGSTKSGSREAIIELVKARKLFIQVKYATPPDIKLHFVKEV